MGPCRTQVLHIITLWLEFIGNVARYRSSPQYRNHNLMPKQSFNEAFPNKIKRNAAILFCFSQKET